jgi:hypothetical protein
VKKFVSAVPKKYWVFGLWAIFVIHDLEEVLTISQFTRNHIQQLSGLIRMVEARLAVSTSEMAIAVGLLILLMFWVAMNVVRFPQSGSWMKIWGLVVGILLANGLTHGVQAIALGMYTPGCITGILLELPAALFSLVWLKQEMQFTTSFLVLCVILGFPLELFFAGFSLILAKAVI